MKKHLATIAAKAASWTPDALMLGGSGAIAWGTSLIYMPAGWIVGGLLLVGGGVLLARSK